MRRLTRSIGLLVLCCSIPLSASASTLAVDLDTDVAIAQGHIDMGPIIVDDVWRLHIKDDTVDPSVWRPLERVVLHVVDASTIRVPDQGFEMLGAPGTQMWLLPQVEQPGVLWAGWNTQDPSIQSATEDPVTWTLHGVEGPGSMVLFLSGSFGQPDVLFDSKQPLPQEISIQMGTHVHGNWAFDQPGIYRLDIEMTASGDAGLTDRRWLTIAVGDEVDPLAALSATTVTGSVTTPTAAETPTGSTATGSTSSAEGGSTTLFVLAGLVLLVTVIAVAARVRR